MDLLLDTPTVSPMPEPYVFGIASVEFVLEKITLKMQAIEIITIIIRVA